jgi:hypothetical protein
MLKTTNNLAKVPLSTPQSGDSTITVPPLFVLSGQIPDALPSVNLTSAGGGSNAFWCSGEIIQAASTGTVTTVLAILGAGVFEINYEYGGVSDWTLAPVNQSLSQNAFYLFGPSGGAIYVIAKVMPTINVPQKSSGSFLVTLAVDGFALRIASCNTAAAQTLYQYARAYVRAVI